MADAAPVSSDIARFTAEAENYDKADVRNASESGVNADHPRRWVSCRKKTEKDPSAKRTLFSAAWIMVATIFCWAIIPGVGLLYSGYTNRRNALSPVWTSLMVMVIGSISWMLFGYTLTYAEGSSFIGDFTYIGSKNVLEVTTLALPTILFWAFQLTFSVATVAIFVGGAIERGRLIPMAVIVFIWPLIVYSPIAHWTWVSTGWLFKLGAYDFAGGSPVHVASGAGSMALSMYMSKPLFRSRTQAGRSIKVMVEHRPHNLLQMTVALVLIWNGWLAFDGGSTLGLNLRSAVALSTTHMSACMGALSWSIWEYAYVTKKWSLSAVVSGAISGLVAITPGCGFVGLPASLLFGFVGGSGCFWMCRFKHTRLAKKIGWVDPVDVTGCHWFGGVLGNLMVGIFAQAEIAATDGASVIAGGWLDGHFIQLGYQLADSVAATGYSFVVTYALVALIDCIPGLTVVATDDEIVEGIDAAYHGEFYGESQYMDEDGADWHPFLQKGKMKDIESPAPSETGVPRPEPKEKGYGRSEVKPADTP